MNRIFIFLLALSLSTQVFATRNGGLSKIEKITLVEDSMLVYIYPVGGVQNAPDCHGSNGDYISFSVSRPMAKEYLSALMAAFATKRNVQFQIADTCSDQSVSATLSYFTVQ